MKKSAEHPGGSILDYFLVARMQAHEGFDLFTKVKH